MEVSIGGSDTRKKEKGTRTVNKERIRERKTRGIVSKDRGGSRTRAVRVN